MAVLCLIVVMIGGLAATALPLVPFVIVLTLALVVGAVSTLLLFPVTSHVIVGAVSLFALAQVGYGLGLGFQGLAHHLRRPARDGTTFGGSSPLRHVNTKD